MSAGGLARDGDPPDEERGDEAHHGEVTTDELGDAGSLHLHDHVLARLQDGSVDLGDRRRRDRLPLELGKSRRERTGQLGLENRPHVLERLGRHLVAKQLELRDHLFGEDPFARGENLAELDVGRTESLEGEPEAP